MKVALPLHFAAWKDVLRKVVDARGRHRAFASAHEGFAVLNEEVDELWDEVRKKDTNRSNRREIYEEARQVAAMAICVMAECGESPRPIST